MLSEFWTREIGGGSLNAAISRAATWYRDEFMALFPRETAARLVDRGDRELLLRLPGDRELWLVDGRGQRKTAISLDEIATSTLAEALTRRGLAPATVKLGLEIPPQAFFVRRFDIPAAAAANLARLVSADIERKTPFKLTDVVYGYRSERRANNPDKIGVELWILRRDIIARAVEASGLDMNDVTFVRPSHAGELAPPTIMLQGAGETSHLFRNIVIGLLISAIALGAVGVGSTLMRQSTLNEELDAQIAAMSARAAKVRKTADGAAAASRLLAVLRDARREGPLFADLWEETSRILPDGAYVTDFRLVEPRTDQRAIEIVGFATSAVGLPALFSKSPMFTDAELTAPITPDEQQKKEGFSLRAQVAPKAKAAK